MRFVKVSVVVQGVVGVLTALYLRSAADIPSILLILFGIGTTSSNGICRWIAAVICGYAAFLSLVVIVSAVAHGVDKVGSDQVFMSVFFGIWAAINTTVLYACHAASNGHTEKQASLRLLITLIAIVCVASWVGTRPVAPNDAWIWEWTSQEMQTRHWSVGVIGYRSGVPAAAYLWRSDGNPGVPSRTIHIVNNCGVYSLLLNGKTIGCDIRFHAFVNDLTGDTKCVQLSPEVASSLFGRTSDFARLEALWAKAVQFRPQEDPGAKPPTDDAEPPGQK